MSVYDTAEANYCLGHPGLTSLCGRTLEGIVAAKLRKPDAAHSLTLEEWQEQFSITTALDNFIARTDNGRRMTATVKQSSACLLLANRLLFAQAQRPPQSLVVKANDAVAGQLVQEGIVRLAVVGSTTELELICPFVAGVVRRVFRPAQLPLLSPKDSSVPDILRLVLPLMGDTALTDNATRHAGNDSMRDSATRAPRESVVTTQLVTALRKIFPPEYTVQQKPTDALPADGASSHPDVVIATNDRAVLVLELGVNMDLKAVGEKARCSLSYHLSKAATYDSFVLRV